ncbi:ABC-three component system protein [Paraburkholderia diazotrophica]|uniref:ABC-three component system protein n=1 Tax=Paraburkholderia diazotrophica TaxID=667676 RepID=UPI0031811909
MAAKSLAAQLIAEFMSISPADYNKWLTLSESPSARDLFFLGPLDRRITFFSQQVRALRLVHALYSQDRFSDSPRVAVVGGGAAGITAAFGCGLLGCRVDLIESTTGLFHLQSKSTRFLHPHIYEWPLCGSLNSHAVLPFLAWKADEAGKIRDQLVTEFTAHRPEKVNVKVSHAVTRIGSEDGEWRLHLKSDAGEISQSYNVVIVAMGFGEEKICGSARSIDYWRDLGPSAVSVELTNKSYFISGSGDGGLTDMMACLVEDFEHFAFTTDFLKNFGKDRLARAAIEADSRVKQPGGDLEPEFKTSLLPVMQDWGVIEYYAKRLRTDRQVTFNAQTVFGKGKASRLNQVMAYAILEAARTLPGIFTLSAGNVSDVQKSDAKFTVSGVVADTAVFSATVDDVVLRHGPNTAVRYSPLGIFFDDYRKHHAELIRDDGTLAEPPQLAVETFEFFDKLYTDACTDIQTKTARQVQAKAWQKELLVSWDAALHKPIQQGPTDLLDLARKIDKLPTPVTLVFALPPKSLEKYLTVLRRLVRASQGQIQVAVLESFFEGWQGRFDAISRITETLNPHPALDLPEAGSLSAMVDATLMKALDAGVQGVVKDGVCTGLGAVHPSIAGAIGVTWGNWKAALTADRQLQASFLRLLFKVEPAGLDPWDGDRACIPDLIAALVLMLATHSGESLAPAECAPGNLSFGVDNEAVCLGSGCTLINGIPVSDVEDAEKWNVDALILAGAREDMFLNKGSVKDGGDRPNTLDRPTRELPVVITAARRWRELMHTGVGAWQEAVKREFDNWRERQDINLREQDASR